MTRRLYALFAVLAILLTPAIAAAQGFVRLQPVFTTDTISSNGDSVTLSSTSIGGFGTVKVQTLDSYTGDWEVRCSVNGTTFDADAELKLTAADSTTVVTSVSNAVGIWDVANAGGCRAIQVIAIGGFAASDTSVVISATQNGGGGGAGGGGGGGSTTITDGSDTALVSAGGELLVSCADCSGSGVSHIDDAAFGIATDDIVPAGAIFDDVATDSVNEGDAGAVRMSANRNLYTQIRDAAGNERGLNIDASGRLTAVVTATDLDIQSGGADLVSSATVTTIFGSDAIFGTAGTADTDVLSVQGIASMTPLLVGDGTGAFNVIVDSGALTVSATNLDVQIGGSDTLQVQSNSANLATETTLAGVIKAEDGVHSSGENGIVALVVRQDSQVDFAADGDRVPLSVDGDGGLRVSIVAGAGSGGTAVADDADFSAGTTSFTPTGGFYQSSVTACTDGDTCAMGITAQRTLKVTLYSAAGAELTPAADATFDSAFITTGPQIMIAAADFDGAALPNAVSGEGDAARLVGSLSGVAYFMPVNEDGSKTPLVDEDVASAAADLLMKVGAIRDDTLDARSATEGDWEMLHLNANGALWVKDVDIATIFGSDAIFGTAGTADTDVLSIQGIASMTPLLTNPGTASTWGVYAEDSAHTSTDPGSLVFGVRQSAQADFGADGDYVPFSIDDDGAVRIAGSIACSNCTGSGASDVDDSAFGIGTDSVAPVGGLFDDNTPDSVDEGDSGMVRMSGNRNLYVRIRDNAGNERGLNIDANGALAAVVSATDLDVQSGGADILSTTAFNAAFGTAGTADTQVMSIQGIASMTPLSVNPGTAANFGIYVEDAAETAGGNLMMAGAVVRTAAVGSSSTNNDNATLNVDGNGQLWVRQLDPCSGVAKSYIPIDITTATTTELTTALAGASNHYYVCALNLITQAANNVSLVDDDTDNCASVTSGLAGGLTAGEGWNIAANGGMTLGAGNGSVMRTGGTNRVLCLVTSAATQLSGHIVVVAAP